MIQQEGDLRHQNAQVSLYDKGSAETDLFWPLSWEWCFVIFSNMLFALFYTCEHDRDYIKLVDLCVMVMCHIAPPSPDASTICIMMFGWSSNWAIAAVLPPRVGLNFFLSSSLLGRPIPPYHLSSAGSYVLCLHSPQGKLTPAHQMHSFKTCTYSFGLLNGLASIDVFSAPLCEGHSLAKLPHLEHMSPVVWTESSSAGAHNEVLSSVSKVSSWFILASCKKRPCCPRWWQSS